MGIMQSIWGGISVGRGRGKKDTARTGGGGLGGWRGVAGCDVWVCLADWVYLSPGFRVLLLCECASAR